MSSCKSTVIVCSFHDKNDLQLRIPLLVSASSPRGFSKLRAAPCCGYILRPVSSNKTSDLYCFAGDFCSCVGADECLNASRVGLVCDTLRGLAANGESFRHCLIFDCRLRLNSLADSSPAYVSPLPPWCRKDDDCRSADFQSSSVGPEQSMAAILRDRPPLCW